MLSGRTRTASFSGTRNAPLGPIALLRWCLEWAKYGTVLVRLPDGTVLEHRGFGPGPDAEIVLLRWRALWRMLLGGEAGVAEAYLDGDWSSPDLLAVLRFGHANERALTPRMRGIPGRGLLRRMRHRLRANTRRGSRRNVVAHYDLGNAFYRAWLDAGMSYSAAFYGDKPHSLEAAQEAKLDLVLSHLGVELSHNVLEIGCGWGRLLERIVEGGMARATGITLSPSQAAFARERMAITGRSETTEVRIQDYRDVSGRFDRIVSIEMVEAVGAAYWGIFFRRIAALLVDGGRAVIQAIVIAEERFETYSRTPDFIQTHVFPGGMLPTAATIRHEAARAGLACEEQLRFGADYARTLAEWRRRFEAAWPRIVVENGFDERFRRLWRYYLAYCEAGFRSGCTDVILFTLDKPQTGSTS